MPGNKQPMENKIQFHIWYFIIAFSLIVAFQVYMSTARQTESISYSQFTQDLVSGRIKDVYIDRDYIYGDYVNPVDQKTKFVTPRLDPALSETLAKYNVEYSGVVRSDFFNNLLSWAMPVIFFFLIWFYGFRSMVEKSGGAGFMAIGRSQAKIYIDQNTGVTFDDVAGVDEAKEELHEIIEFLKNPKEYERLGAHMPKGILLVGPPGTGKTLLAKAIAGEAGVPFFSISGSEFIEMFVGVGAARVRDLFEQAREHAPAIIFIDELDALGRARGAFSPMGGHDEREQTLNQLLAEMDGFDTSRGVVMLAATNRPEILDPALLRAGRFDRQVLVDRPDQKGRVQVLKVHIKNVILAPDADLEKIAALTTGFSGADLANLVNEAAIHATRNKRDAVTLHDFTMAVERIVAGLEKRSRILTPFERRIVAYHEMGHALVAIALPGVDVVHKVSIVPRGIGSLGYTIQRPAQDRYLMTREELENKMTILMGGRVAEKIIFSHSSTGAADDLAKATDIAHDMVARYGMDEALGYVCYEQAQSPLLGEMPFGFQPRKYSEATAQQIDDAVRNLIKEAADRATQILQENRAVLDRCVIALLKTETLEGARLKELTAVMSKDVAKTA